jgi:diguanylate cyclase
MVYKFAEQEDWRRKYSESIRAFEQEERRNRAQLQTLHKLVNRLCLAAQGQSPRLDQELDRLKTAIRKDAPGEQLDQLGQAIADAVRLMDTEATGSERSPASPQMVAKLLEQGEPRQAVSFAQASVEPEATTPARPARAGDAGTGEAHIRLVLSRLLTELGREPQLAPGAQAIDAELSAATSADRLPQLIEKAGGLVVQRIASLERSRHEIESLLDQMMGQLDSLTQHMAGQAADESARTRSSVSLNEQINGEMRALGENVESATDLTLIRVQLRDRLDSISTHLHSYRQREEMRARQSRERNESMRVRMDAMESEVRKLQERLVDKKRQLLLDSLTKIPNRAAWEERLVEERERWKRFRQPTCIAVWDIDRFKVINDTYGHRAGDKVLTVVAEALSKDLRTTDFVARYGGEEFVMLLPGTTVADGMRLANQIRETIGQIGFHFRGQPVSVSISCGVTAMQEGDSGEDAFDRADEALYKAKDSGRNRVVSA